MSTSLEKTQLLEVLFLWCAMEVMTYRGKTIYIVEKTVFGLDQLHAGQQVTLFFPFRHMIYSRPKNGIRTHFMQDSRSMSAKTNIFQLLKVN